LNSEIESCHRDMGAGGLLTAVVLEARARTGCKISTHDLMKKHRQAAKPCYVSEVKAFA